MATFSAPPPRPAPGSERAEPKQLRFPTALVVRIASFVPAGAYEIDPQSAR